MRYNVCCVRMAHVVRCCGSPVQCRSPTARAVRCAHAPHPRRSARSHTHTHTHTQTETHRPTGPHINICRYTSIKDIGTYKYAIAPEARRPKDDQRGDVIVWAMCALSYLKPDPDDARVRAGSNLRASAARQSETQ